MAVRIAVPFERALGCDEKKLTDRSTCFGHAVSSPRRLPSPPSLTRAQHALAHARTLPSPYAMIPSQQTRRSTRRSLPNAQGVENDVANRMSSTAAGRANNALATGSAAVKPPTTTKVVAGTSNQARRPLATGKAVLADKVRFFVLHLAKSLHAAVHATRLLCSVRATVVHR